MSVRHCLVCSKMLPESHSGSVCGLCSIGFTPVQNPQPALPLEQSQPAPVQSAVIPGISGLGLAADRSCTDCGAELSQNDLRAGNCAICGHSITALQAGGFDELRASAPRFDADKDLGETEWPSEAPLW